MFLKIFVIVGIVVTASTVKQGKSVNQSIIDITTYESNQTSIVFTDLGPHSPLFHGKSDIKNVVYHADFVVYHTNYHAGLRDFHCCHCYHMQDYEV